MHPTGHQHEHAAVHGMVLFGDTTLYLSHMPLFDAPHNDQVILEVTLSKKGSDPVDTYRKDRASSGAGFYSVRPEEMVLSELKAGASFTGDIHRGDFEQGGTRILRDVTITVESVVLSTKLDPQTKADPTAGRRYLCFGKPGELFAIHEITAPPSFDQVLEISLPDAKLAASVAFPAAVPLRVPGTDAADSRLKAGEAGHADFPETPGPDGNQGLRTRILADEEIFFDDRFLS